MKKSQTSIASGRRVSPASVFVLTAAIAALGANLVHAQATWVGDTDQDWNTAANWSSDPANPTGNFTINTSTGNYPVLTTNSAFTPVDIFVGSGGGSGRLDHSAGLLSAGSGNWSFVGNGAGSTGIYNLTGSSSFTSGRLLVAVGGGTGTVNINTSGTVTANAAGGDWWNSSGLAIGIDGGSTGVVNLQAGTITTSGSNRNTWVGVLGGNGTLTQTGGTINTDGLSLARYLGTGTMSVTNGTVNAGSVNLSHAGNAGDTSIGTLTVNSGGVVNSEGDFVVGFAGTSSSQGTLNVNTGAMVNVGTTAERWMVVNQWDTVKGIINVDGGTINLNTNTDLRYSTGNSTGASVVNLNSGAITSYSGNGAGSSTSGVVDLNQAGGASANNTFNLNGGTLTTSQVITNNNNGTATFNFNGGVLKAANTSANFVDLGGAGQTAVVKAGGAIIDSNSFDVTIPQPLLDGSGGGGLTKDGLGTLTLSGANTFVGDTTVNAGGLTIGSTGSLLFSVTDGGSTNVLGSGSFTFDGTMKLDLSGVTVSAGSWQLIDTGSLTTSFGGTFAVVDNSGGLTFSKAGQIWTSNDSLWSFSELTGTLSQVPEPSTYAMVLGSLTLGVVAIRRRRRV